MQRFRDFLKRKDIEISLRRYGIDSARWRRVCFARC